MTINNGVTMGDAAVGAALLADRYRIVRQLGQGGMGSVWLAEDVQLDGKLFAVKMLPSILVSNKRAYNQLKAEALVSMKLTHPNIVTLRAFEENDGNPFLVMDYVDGQTLDDYLAEKGMLSGEEMIRLLKPVAEALDYAHREGIVHRDVKPSNVMIRNDGHPFVLDFGIAREMQETLTRVTGKMSSGTLMYMSPEQLNGEAPKPPQDVYSFAAMVYECLTGHPPFFRGAIEDQIKNKPPEPLPETAGAFAGVIAGLAKDPENRPAMCAVVLNAGIVHAEYAGRENPNPEKRGDGASGRGRSTSNGTVRIFTGLLLAGVLGCGVWYWHDLQEKARIAAEAEAAELARAAEERKAAEKARLAREEAERLARKTAERKAEEKKAEEKRRLEREAAERKNREEQQRRAAEKKITEDALRAKQESERKAEQKRAEEKRVAEEKRIAEEKRVAEEKRIAEERLMAEAKLAAEKRRIAENGKKKTDGLNRGRGQRSAPPRKPSRWRGSQKEESTRLALGAFQVGNWSLGYANAKSADQENPDILRWLGKCHDPCVLTPGLRVGKDLNLAGDYYRRADEIERKKGTKQ